MIVFLQPARGHDKCRVKVAGGGLCGNPMRREMAFVCPLHGKGPDRMVLTFKGQDVADLTGKNKYDLRYDNDNIPISYEKAKYLLKKIQEEQSRGTFNIRHYVEKNRDQLRFRFYVESYFHHLQARADRDEFSAPNLELQRAQASRHLSFFDDYDVREINRGLITRWFDSHEASAKTKNKTMVLLRTILNWAYDNEDINEKPRRMPFASIPSENPMALTRDQQELIIRCAKEKHKIILSFGMETMHRPSVIRALKVKDIDWSRGVYTTCRRWQGDKVVPGLKTKRKSAEYPIRPELRILFTEALKDRLIGPETFVFENQRAKGKWKPYTRQALSFAFTFARDEAGLKGGITLYSFIRHSGASQMADVGVPGDMIAEVMDNTAPVVRKHYRSVTAESMAKVFDFAKRSQKVAKRKDSEQSGM